MINIFHFTRRLLLVSLIFLNITTVANAANFVWYKNPNSGVAALAPVNWIMPEQLYKENITTTLLRVFSPDAKMHLEVVTFNEYYPVRTLAEFTQDQINDLTTDMVSFHLALFKGSELIYLTFI